MDGRMGPFGICILCRDIIMMNVQIMPNQSVVLMLSVHA